MYSERRRYENSNNERCVSLHSSADGLETFFWERLVSVSRVWKNRTSRSRLGLEGSTSRSRLGLEYITSRSRSRDFSLVNMRAMHQACGYIMKKIMDLTRKKQFVKWQTSPVGVFKLQHCGLDTFFWNVSVSRLGLGGLETFFGTSRLVSVLWLNVLWTSLSPSIIKLSICYLWC